MALVNYDKIINGTSSKRIINGYNTMKDNYTEESANDFLNVYSNEPLSAVLENSRLIFSEPYQGSKFYSSHILDASKICLFESYNDEIDKVSSYMEKYGDSMSVTQKDIYSNLLTEMGDTKSSLKNTMIFSEYIREKLDDTFEKDLSSVLYEYLYNHDESKNYEEIFIEKFNDNDPKMYITYAPYVIKAAYENGEIFNELSDMASGLILESRELEDTITMLGSVLCANKLKGDSAYIEAVNTIPRSSRVYFNTLMEMSLQDIISSATESEMVKEEDVVHATVEGAINSIFNDIDLAPTRDFDGEESRENVKLINSYAYESTFEIMQIEYTMSESTDDITKGYSLLSDSDYTIESAISALKDQYIKIDPLFMEAGETEDVTDDDINSMNGDITGKKPLAPSSPDKYTKIQNKYMDKEAKRMNNAKIKEQKGQRKKGMFRAIFSAPQNFINKLKGEVNKLDEMDDNRRKDYMTKPGFRKKWFRNLKLAILYGGATAYKIALLPIVMMGRHFSKQKDRRMRNELVRELDTSIEVVNEKINDANAESDRKEKYRLIRIKNQLQAERTRVLTNSKYI